MTSVLKSGFFKTVLLAIGVSLMVAACDQNRAPKPDVDLAREILAQLIAIKSVDDGSGSSVVVAEAMAKRLTDAGFPPEDVLVTGPRPEVGVVVARYRGDGTGGAPIIVMAHMDVVDALPSDWSRDPFTLEEDESYFYGRGVGDNKTGVVSLVVNFIRLKDEGYVPDRDIIMVLTGDEETTGGSINWLANQRRDLIEAEFALNTDASGGLMEGGQYIAFMVQASEKMYLTFNFTVRNSGGHSSVPRPDNAIYELMAGLARLEVFSFPDMANQVTRNQFIATAKILEGDFAAALTAVGMDQATPEQMALVRTDPRYNSLTRTTCVATMLSAGHAENALPQSAVATVNCRIFPGVSADQVEAKLLEVMAIEGVEVERLNIPKASDPSPLTPEVMEPVTALVKKHFGDIPVIPNMSTGATDGLYLRNVGIPVYAMSAIFAEPGSVNAHGRDEKILVRSFYEAVAFWYDLMKAVTGGGD
ncbi:MAG: M20/M25/M40 family metallo-hydrolase [Proteobacteria bacterium]|nr:M20/M25/M40 family metallo-hydrolase [Pseudomonadota bacterium]